MEWKNGWHDDERRKYLELIKSEPKLTKAYHDAIAAKLERRIWNEEDSGDQIVQNQMKSSIQTLVV